MMSYSEYSDSLDNVSLKGVVLKKQYLLIQQIGSGHYATVWLTYDLINHKCFATKVYDIYHEEDGRNEIEVQARAAGCKYVLSIVDTVEEENEDGILMCLVYPLMGGNLYELNEQTRLTLDQVNYVTQFLVKGVRELHQRHIYHLDIKPENILYVGSTLEQQVFTALGKLKNVKKIKKKLLESEFKQEISMPDNLQILISDIGGSVSNPEERPESTTKYYAPPESKFRYVHSITSDVWSIGCVRYELLTGEILFDVDDSECETRQYLQLLFTYCGEVPTVPPALYLACFRKDGGIKGVESIKYTPIQDEFVRKCIVIDQHARPTLEQL